MPPRRRKRSRRRARGGRGAPTRAPRTGAPVRSGAPARAEGEGTARRAAPRSGRRRSLFSQQAALSGDLGALRRFELLAGAAEAPFAAAVGGNRHVERRGVEVRPQRLREIRSEERRVGKEGRSGG